MKFRILLSIATITALFTLGFVGYTEAFEILKMEPEDKNYDVRVDGSLVLHTATLETDEPYYSVSWYVNDVLAGYSYGGHAKTKASFTPTPPHFDLTVYGTRHTIKAVACRMDAPLTDTASYDVTAYRPTADVVDSDNGFGGSTGAWVHAEVTSIGWRGATAYWSLYGEIANITGQDLFYAFKYQLWITRITQPGEKAEHLQDIYTLPLVVNRGKVSDGDTQPLVDLESPSKSYDGLKNWDWEEEDVFRVEAETTVAVSHYVGWKPQDKFKAEGYQDLTKPRND